MPHRPRTNPYGTEAVQALRGRESLETLMLLARRSATFSHSALRAATEVAEPLVIGQYRRINPADRLEVLDAMGWLTTAALSDRSA